jgi:hypothetical protein
MKKVIKKIFDKIVHYIDKSSIDNQVRNQLSKAAAIHLNINDFKPYTWEFSGFSQNGEDGIIDFLTNKIRTPNKYFVEIGASNGIENNTSYLAIVKRYSGLMVEGDPLGHTFCVNLMKKFSLGVECVNMFVDKESIQILKEKLLYKNPDVFSLDIDGNDYYLAQVILEQNIRPKIFVVEYNSAFGPIDAVTIEYDKNFVMSKAHPSCLYYGVSIMAWRKLFEVNNYQFLGVDSNGVNAFFIDNQEFDETFYSKIERISFKENFYQLKKFTMGWNAQFEVIRHLPLIKI